MKMVPTRALASATVMFVTAAAGAAAVVYPEWTGAVGAKRSAEALEAGDAATALVLARKERPSARLRFLEGAALLGLSRFSEARSAFSASVAMTQEPELIRRALHNIALADLHLADESEPGGAGVHARASVAAGRDALRLDPRSEGTRWNLALAQRLLEDNLPDGAPTSGDRGGVEIGAAGGAGAQASGSARAMTPLEAAGILDALRSGEAESLRAMLARTFESTGNGSTRRGPPW